MTYACFLGTGSDWILVLRPKDNITLHYIYEADAFIQSDFAFNHVDTTQELQVHWKEKIDFLLWAKVQSEQGSFQYATENV